MFACLVSLQHRRIDEVMNAPDLAPAAPCARTFGIACQARERPTLAELPPADVVTHSRFLHHLDRHEAVTAPCRMDSAARHLLLLSDLRCPRAGLIAAWIGCRLLSASPMIRFDGPASVRGAWGIHELRRMALEAGLYDARATPAWPWRMLRVRRRHP